MRRATTLLLLLVASCPGVARSIDQCVNLASPENVFTLRQELSSLKIPYRVDQITVCVDEVNGSKFFAVVSKLFSAQPKNRHLKTPRTPSGVAAESFTFNDPTKQVALEASLRRKGIWFEKDESGTMWYEVTNGAVVRDMIFAINEGDSHQRSNSPVKRDAPLAARPLP